KVYTIGLDQILSFFRHEAQHNFLIRKKIEIFKSLVPTPPPRPADTLWLAPGVPGGPVDNALEEGTVDTISQQAARLQKEWDSNPHWKDTARTYSAEDVVRLRGSVVEEFTLARR